MTPSPATINGLGGRVIRVRTLLRYAKDPRVEAGLKEFIANAEKRLKLLQSRRLRPLDIDDAPGG